MKVSIFSLIYKSPKFADFVYDSIKKNTPMLETREAEFYFVLNRKLEESNKVWEHLLDKNYKFYQYDEELLQRSYPANIGAIYNAWNYGASKANGDIIVMVNSDMIFTKDWLENLLKNLKKDRVVTSRLVESGKLRSTLSHTISKDFGRTIDGLDEESFIMFAESVKEDKIEELGTFMPVAIHKDLFEKSGGYPNGNLVAGDGTVTSGDVVFFYETLENLGVKHYTVFDSIVYHFQEGESDE